ncbi:MAG: DUF3597 domain-containing protein [Altererythrobacter sp.]|nr:DUF3597 domain-containing protein [Altererythrobacter sp.]
MSIFGRIKDAIFGSSAKDSGQPKPAPAAAPAPSAAPAAVAPAAPQPVTIVNVENSLDSMPGADRLNWRTSIVDLMKLINVESDYASRKALAAELGREDYSGSAEDNIWLHKRVMQELASNGGQVPDSLR